MLPPKVTLTAPVGSGLRLNRAEVEVKAAAESVGEHPVTALRLLVDGRPYQGQAGLKRVVFPRENEPDLEELPPETRKALEFIPADKIEDVFSAAFRANGKR